MLWSDRRFLLNLPRFASLLVSILLLLASAYPVVADIGSALPVADPDAEFARAADLLEAGRRQEGEALLAEIERRLGQPSWEARIALLRGFDEARRGDLAGACATFSSMDARSVGLEPYRLLALAEWSAASLRGEQARRFARLAFEWPDAFAFRHRAGKVLADLLEREGHLREALRVRERASEASEADEALLYDQERARLASRLSDGAALEAAARHLWLISPASWETRGLSSNLRAAGERAERRLSPAERVRIGQQLAASGLLRRAERELAIALEGRLAPAERLEARLARVRLLLQLQRWGEAGREVLRVREPPASLEARRLQAEILLARYGRQHGRKTPPGVRGPFDPRRSEIARVVRLLDAVAQDPATATETRKAALERQVMLVAADESRWQEGVEIAARLAALHPSTRAGFEPLWLGAWQRYAAHDAGGALARLSQLRAIYTRPTLARQIDHWRARCLASLGRGREARFLWRGLVMASVLDVYGRFALERLATAAPVRAREVYELAKVSGPFRRVDELLRLRRFEEARAETRASPPGRERNRRLALAEFALGNFVVAGSLVKSVFPEIGTFEEWRVPDEWRRLYYPIEADGLVGREARAQELDPALLRAVVRQESTFHAAARSRAGAIGLMQLMPATARRLTQSVLGRRFRRAFLYDPGVNVRLGTAYLRRLLDRFGGDLVLALAAYNGGPERITPDVASDMEEDVKLESVRFSESRQYVRNVLLFREAYRELYPE